MSTRNKMFIKIKVLLFTTFIFLTVFQVIVASGNRKYIKKCCPMEKYVGNRKRCIDYEEKLNFSTLQVYDQWIYSTGDFLEDVFTLVPNAFDNRTFKTEVLDVIEMDYNAYLIEDGYVQVELPNTYNRWRPIPPGNYCIDYRIKVDNTKTTISLGFWAYLEDEPVSTQSNPYITYTMLISCFFMLLVFIVYCLLPELRNLGGMILMAYITCLFMSFLLLTVIQLITITKTDCVSLTCGIYFFLLATFCWMNVMSYDIWWKFRGYVKARSINRQGERCKFLMYCLYALGIPLVMTIGLFMLNFMKKTMRSVPWFVIPHIPENGCFLLGAVKMFYLYIPMLILISCNWLFYLMTALKVWRLSRLTDMLNSGPGKKVQMYKRQLAVYLKLSVVMGLIWVLEIISFLFPGYDLWYLFDAYNILVGLAMFIIFVCKKKIWKKLHNRYILKNKIQENSTSKTDPRNKSENQEYISLKENTPHSAKNGIVQFS